MNHSNGESEVVLHGNFTYTNELVYMYTLCTGLCTAFRLFFTVHLSTSVTEGVIMCLRLLDHVLEITGSYIYIYTLYLHDKQSKAKIYSQNS